jgi:hypothetical protein
VVSVTVNESFESKKRYEQPNLRVYGDIRLLTQAVAMMGQTDNGSAPTAKT